MSNIMVTGMGLFVWRTVVSLLGGFPALRDAAGTKGESSSTVVGGGLLRAYRNWQLILSTLLLRTVPASSPFLFPIPCFWRIEAPPYLDLYGVWIHRRVLG